MGMVITIELVLGQPKLILLNNSESGWQKITAVKMDITIELVLGQPELVLLNNSEMVITIELVLGQPKLILLNNSESGWQKITAVKMVITIDLLLGQNSDSCLILE